MSDMKIIGVHDFGVRKLGSPAHAVVFSWMLATIDGDRCVEYSATTAEEVDKVMRTFLDDVHNYLQRGV